MLIFSTCSISSHLLFTFNRTFNLCFLTLFPLQADAEKMCKMIMPVPIDGKSLRPCCLSADNTTSFKILSSELGSVKDSISYNDLDIATRENVRIFNNQIIILT